MKIISPFELAATIRVVPIATLEEMVAIMSATAGRIHQLALDEPEMDLNYASGAADQAADILAQSFGYSESELEEKRNETSKR